HHLGAGAEELPVQLFQRVRGIQDDLGDVGARLDIPAPLQLEHVTLGVQDDALLEPLQHALNWHARSQSEPGRTRPAHSRFGRPARAASGCPPPAGRTYTRCRASRPRPGCARAGAVKSDRCSGGGIKYLVWLGRSGRRGNSSWQPSTRASKSLVPSPAVRTVDPASHSPWLVAIRTRPSRSAMASTMTPSTMVTF